MTEKETRILEEFNANINELIDYFILTNRQITEAVTRLGFKVINDLTLSGGSEESLASVTKIIDKALIKLEESGKK